MTEELVPSTPMGLTTHSGLNEVKEYRKRLMEEPTPSEYIKIKDKFPYLPSKYVDDTFNRWFPIYNTDVVSRTETESHIYYTVKLTVLFPNGITMSRVGSGGQEKHVFQKSKDEVLAGKRNINSWDYVNPGNADKAALTLAISNCQQRFGIGADITERLILTPEQIEETNDAIKGIMELISNPGDKIKWKRDQGLADTPNKKMKFLVLLKDAFPELVEEYLSKEKETNK